MASTRVAVWLASFLFTFAVRFSAVTWIVSAEFELRTGHDSRAKRKTTYGVDVSLPIHYKNSISINYDYFPHNILPSLYPTPQMFHNMPIQPLGDRKAFYKEFLQQCYQQYEMEICDEYEDYRIRLNLQQPKSMVNYTTTGYKILKASSWDTDSTVWKMLSEFWDLYKEDWTPEVWPDGNTYVNHWASPTFMVSVEQYRSLRGSVEFQESLWQAAKAAVSDWIPQVDEWIEYSMYGIRVYTEDAILNSHVDRLPQVISIVINVAQDVDQPWPMELIGHDGVAHNVTMQPGDWLMYESHSIIHGRPFPLQGNFYANLFLHLEPKGHTQTNHGHAGANEQDHGGDMKKQYQTALEQRSGGHETESINSADGYHYDLPPYILPDSVSALEFLEETTEEQQQLKMLYSSIHDLAGGGKLPELIDLVEGNQRHLVNAKDDNGWTPLHEAARGGFVDVVRYLVDRGADIHARSHDGTGGNALFYSQEHHGEHHPVSLYLESLGAVSVGPEEL